MKRYKKGTVMFCKTCGHALNNKAVICTGCGCRVETETSPVAAYALAVTIPIVGFGYALYLGGVKGRPGLAVGVCLTSIVAWLCWWCLLMGGCDGDCGGTGTKSYEDERSAVYQYHQSGGYVSPSVLRRYGLQY